MVGIGGFIVSGKHRCLVGVLAEGEERLSALHYHYYGIVLAP